MGYLFIKHLLLNTYYKFNTMLIKRAFYYMIAFKETNKTDI